ncbi:MAG: hypothetical protein IPK59_03995 [Rhodospirillaceae bacterium]|nr:hypothetical protein [Rhodospirillaceae bacterium]
MPALDDAEARRLLGLHGWQCGELDLCKKCVKGRDAGADGILLLIDQAKARKTAHG